MSWYAKKKMFSYAKKNILKMSLYAKKNSSYAKTLKHFFIHKETFF